MLYGSYEWCGLVFRLYVLDTWRPFLFSWLWILCNFKNFFCLVLLIESQLRTICGDALQACVVECVQYIAIESIHIVVVWIEFEFQIRWHYVWYDGFVVFGVFFVLGQVGAEHGQNIQLIVGDGRQHFPIDIIQTSTTTVKHASSIRFGWHGFLRRQHCW